MQENKDNTVIMTYNELKNGQIKCKYCGATDINFNKNTGLLKCNYCRKEFEQEKINEETDISKLEGKIIGSGAQNIVADSSDIVTFKCQGCGAEVVIDTKEAYQARCHWCRSFLSVNQQIPNGSVPDAVLPFSVKKEEAELKIREFVEKRKFFAHPRFKKEFNINNIMGVYLPYMLVDINAHAFLSGEGEHLVRRYTVKRGDRSETYYDADLFEVERDFDITIDDLSIEASLDKLDTTSSSKTTNIINSIMPFDTENCVVWNANYLKGYSSEKRDTNVDQLSDMTTLQAKDISRIAINDTLKNYDRGVSWQIENLNIKGERWKSAYLPVWLYSYQQVKGKKKLLHYVAVNARTSETMGSVPVNTLKLLFISAIVEILGLFLMLGIDFKYDWIFLSIGVIFYLCMYSRYRNSNKRHVYEKETKKQIFNIKSKDNYIKRRRGLSNSSMIGANNTNIYGNKVPKNLSNLIANNIDKTK